MNYDIFENNEKKLEAQHQLTELQKHPGWEVITRALDANIAFLNDELREKRDFPNLEALYALQDRINDFKKLKDLPETILKELEPNPEEEDQEIYD